MEPIKRTERSAYPNGPRVDVAKVDDKSTKDDLDSFVLSVAADEEKNEKGDLGFLEDNAPKPEELDKAEKEAKKMSDEEIKVKALNQAISIAKLMSGVTVDDIIEIAKKTAKYIKGV